MSERIVPLINGVEYAWSDIVCAINGIPVIGITGIEYASTTAKENNYGSGRHPVSRSRGKKEFTGKITLYQSEVLALQRQAPNGDITDIAPFSITVSYLPEGGVICTDKILMAEFMNNSRSWKEGDMNQQVELELIIGLVEFDKGNN